MEELDAGNSDTADLLSLIVSITKADVSLVDGFEPAVGDGDAKNVASEVVEHLIATAGMLGMDDPFFLPE